MTRNFGVSIQRLRTDGNPSTDTEIHLFCVNPAIAIRRLQNAGYHSLIMMSGTLTSREAMTAEFGLEFVYSITNDHVVPEKNIQVGESA